MDEINPKVLQFFRHAPIYCFVVALIVTAILMAVV